MKAMPYPVDGIEKGAETSLGPLSVVRTETVLSKLPVHNLAKKGSISIQIAQKTEDGNLDLYWEVSPSRNYGEPRQLAYKLDTIVVNRKLDELAKPLPQIVRLGGLRDLSRALGSTMAGTNRIRNALRQNAGALITAKFRYKGTDRSEHSIDASFTRYGVVFTGEKLPTGARADAVYLILNQPYLDVLNNAPVRPLDYDYLKALTPAAQRFYEIVSYRIFAAFNHGRREARLAYSEFCMFSALDRYADYDHFKKQMYKVHRPHLNSGYLKATRYERTMDAEGNVDWDMYYEPGPKAKAEYRSFSRKTPLETQLAMRGDGEEQTSLPVQLAKKQAEQNTEPKAQVVLNSESLHAVQRFHELARGVTAYTPVEGGRELKQAEDLLKRYGTNQVNFIIDFAVRSAIRTHFHVRTFGAVLQYVPEALAAHGAIERSEREARRVQLEREARANREEAEVRRAEGLLKSLDPNQYEALYVLVKADLTAKYPDIVAWKGASVFETMIKLKMAERLKDRGRQAP